MLLAYFTHSEVPPVIDGFAAQPFPLWAVIASAVDHEPITCRVVGWQRTEGAEVGELAPVLTLGTRTFVPREGDVVEFYSDEASAEAAGPVLAEASRRRASRRTDADD